MTPETWLARIIDIIICPDCGQPGEPSVAIFDTGVTLVIPRFQCSTDGCDYHHDGPHAWTLAFSS